MVAVRGPNSINIERGEPFQRQELWTDRAGFRIKDAKDNDAVPVFQLWMKGPGGRSVSEAYSRRRVE